jgi:hypothetical protein
LPCPLPIVVCDLPFRRINTIDADDVALAVVRALEVRTHELQDANARLQKANDELTARLERLERKFKQQ